MARGSAELNYDSVNASGCATPRWLFAVKKGGEDYATPRLIVRIEKGGELIPQAWSHRRRQCQALAL